MKTSELIEKLSHELPKKSRPVKSEWRQVLYLGCTGLGLSLIAISVLKIRPDLSSISLESFTPFLAGVLGALACLAGSVVFLTSVPGRTEVQTVAKSIYGLLGVLILVLAVRPFLIHDTPWAEGLSWGGRACAISAFATSLILGAGIYLRVRRLAPTNPALTGSFIGLTSALWAGFALNFSCSVNHSVHVLAYHIILPTTAACLCGAWLGNRLLRW